MEAGVLLVASDKVEVEAMEEGATPFKAVDTTPPLAEEAEGG